MNDAGSTVRGTALLTKALDIVELVAESDNRLKFKDIADRTGHSKSTLYRILAALSARGMIDLDRRDQSYVLGPKFTEMAGSINNSSDLIAVSASALKAIADQQGENVNLAILIGTAQVTISRWQGRLAHPFPSPLGERKPLHATGLGKAMLSVLPDAELSRILQQLRLTPYTERTHTSIEALAEDLEMIRARGFSIDDNEIIDGVTCVAAPILSATGEAIAAVSITGPSHRMPVARQLELASVLRRTTRQISQLLAPQRSAGQDIETSISERGHAEVMDTRAFSSAIVPGSVTEEGFSWIDGPSGMLFATQGNVHRQVLRVDQIDAAQARPDGTVELLTNATLTVVSTDGSAEAGEAPEALRGATAFRRLTSGELVFMKGGCLYRLLPEHDQPVLLADGLLDAAGFDLDDEGRLLAVRAADGVALVYSGAGAAPVAQRLPLRGQPSGVAFDHDRGIWVSHQLSWSVTHLDPEGGHCVEMPVSVPTLKGLCAGPVSRSLLAGSERLLLPQSALDVAPASGGVLRISLARGR